MTQSETVTLTQFFHKQTRTSIVLSFLNEVESTGCFIALLLVACKTYKWI